jgi:hypothetical protein
MAPKRKTYLPHPVTVGAGLAEGEMVCKEIYGVILDGAALCTDLGSSSNYSGEIQLLK